MLSIQSSSFNLFLKIFFIVFAILAPIHTTMSAVGFLIIVDFVTGIWAAKKRGEKISSAAMRRTVSKLLIYQLCIISGFVLEHFLLGDELPVTKTIAGIIGSVELKSVFENTTAITGMDLFKELIKRLGSKNDMPPSA